MSQENVEVVRSSFEAFARGDFGSAFSSYDPNTEWCPAVDHPDQQTHRGIAELEALVESLAEPWVAHRVWPMPNWPSIGSFSSTLSRFESLPALRRMTISPFRTTATPAES